MAKRTRGTAVATAKGFGERKLEKPVVLSRNDILSSGSTLLNLAATDNPHGCYVAGRYYFFVGDSDSGKTWYSMSAFAESELHPRFKKHRLIHDDVELGCNMDIGYYFGQAVADRIEPPRVDDKGEPVYSKTIEDFYDNWYAALQQGDPFIYILDSQDCLSSEQEQGKITEDMTARQKGKDHTGTMTDGKAKISSQRIRGMIGRLPATGSIVILINQTRSNMGMGGPNTYSGGRALKFYATLQLWSSRAEMMKRTFRDKERQTGILSEVALKKNRLTGHEAKVKIPIYHSYGIDDIGACIDYLMSEKWWKKEKQTILAREFQKKASKDGLIKHILDDPDGTKLFLLRETVATCWNEIRAATALDRPPRYS